jgi:hypothetical protein
MGLVMRIDGWEWWLLVGGALQVAGVSIAAILLGLIAATIGGVAL